MFKIILSLFVFSSILLADQYRDMYVKASKAFESGDAATAFKLFKQISESDSILKLGAKFNLGKFYYFGKGTQKDKEKAARIWEESCEVDIAVACDYLTFTSILDEEIKLSPEKFVKYATKGCDLNNAHSCITLALAYMDEVGGLKYKVSKIEKLLKKACDLGSEDGCKRYLKFISD